MSFAIQRKLALYQFKMRWLLAGVVIAELMMSIVLLALAILTSWRIPFLIKLCKTPKFLMDLIRVPKIKYPL